MNKNANKVHNSDICIGCLSNDRTLSEITHTDTKTLFLTLINDREDKKPILLCFECKSIMQKIINFKSQVNKAQNALQLYLSNKTTPKSLTNLKQTKTEINYYFNDNNDITDHNNYLIDHNNDIKDNFKYRTDHFNDIKLNNDKIINELKNNYIIKQENDIESVFINDNYQHIGENNDMIGNDNDHYNDSDEEPLCTLKNDKKYKRKRKEKSKNNSKDTEHSRVVFNPRIERKLKQLNVDPKLIQMIVLSWEEVEQQRQASLSSSSFTSSQYKCELCAIAFNHRTKLETHMKKHDPISGNIVCDICKIRFKNDKALYAHKRRHRVRWRCAECGRQCSRASVCADHVARAHTHTRPTHTCTHCGDTRPSLGKLKLHMRTHLEPVSCEICGKTYKDKDTLRTHLFIHNGEREFQCNKCDKKFLFKKALEIHELSHGANQYLYCHECDVSFKNQLSYYQHMKYNLKHIDPAKMKYSCGVCGRRFIRLSRLTEHTRALHTNETPIVCDHGGCNKSFPSRASFRSHRRLVHRGVGRDAIHVCPTCGHRYKSKKSLEGHMRTHSGERPYVCPCGDTFTYSAALNAHKKHAHHNTDK